jgi:hypothetical protein
MSNIVVMPNFKEYSTKEDTIGIKNSKLLWEVWCKKYGHDFLVLEEPVCSYEAVCPQMQKMWVMDILEENGIDFDQILEVDHDTYPTPSCPDVFKLSGNEFSAALDNGFGPQLNRLMILFRDNWFKNDKFVTWDTYFNSGFIIYNKNHKELFKKTQEWYFKYRKEFAVVNKADDLNDQTILNFVLADMGYKLNILPRSYNVLDLHMERFFIPSYTDELGRYLDRDRNIIDCINVFHITNWGIRDQGSEYLKKVLWKL